MSAYALDMQTGASGAVRYTQADIERIENLRVAIALGMRLGEVEEMPDYERWEILEFLRAENEIKAHYMRKK